MPILNPIHHPHSGKVGVLKWKGTAEEFSRKLKNKESAILVKISPFLLLLSVGKEDKYLLDNADTYHSPKTETSIYIHSRLSLHERDEIISILQILINNGSIQEYGMNIRRVQSGTFLNFHHKCAKDCNLVRPFVEYILNY